MKRELQLSIMSLLFAIVTSILTIGLTSCDKEEETTSAGNIEGTAWINDRVEDVFNETYGVQLAFTANNRCTFSLLDANNTSIVIESVFGTYTANGNNVSITFDDEYELGNATAVINGRNMRFTVPDEYALTLTKL